jgi:SAM-dependent methyltransferase
LGEFKDSRASAGSNLYDARFFEAELKGALESARIVVPIVVDVVMPKSVVDVGCGLGAWLRAFQENGVSAVRGFDGTWVDQSKLLIDRECFTAVDLGRPMTIGQKYDLAVCLEVAEHLPSRNNRSFVQMLTWAAPFVLFSTAIPGQGGSHHCNEQWPSYWRALFAEAGFKLLDPVRPWIIHDSRVEWWYRQNTVLFASDAALSDRPELKAQADAAAQADLEWVHVTMLERYRSLSCILRHAPGAAWRVISRRWAGV